jgi:hypothetical protein
MPNASDRDCIDLPHISSSASVQARSIGRVFQLTRAQVRNDRYNHPLKVRTGYDRGKSASSPDNPPRSDVERVGWLPSRLIPTPGPGPGHGHIDAAQIKVASLARIVIPLFADVPFIPDIQVVYWIDTSILPAGDPESQRPVVVMAVPTTTNGTIRVATRSSTERNGIPHSRSDALGLSKDGWFSRRANILGELWTLSNVISTGELDDETFAAVCARFL